LNETISLVCCQSCGDKPVLHTPYELDCVAKTYTVTDQCTGKCFSTVKCPTTDNTTESSISESGGSISVEVNTAATQQSQTGNQESTADHTQTKTTGDDDDDGDGGDDDDDDDDHSKKKPSTTGEGFAKELAEGNQNSGVASLHFGKGIVATALLWILRL